MVLELSQGVSGTFWKCLVILFGCLLGIFYPPLRANDLPAQTGARDVRVINRGGSTQLADRSKRYALIVGVDAIKIPKSLRWWASAMTHDRFELL
jgi:hypothetical protein